jgi:hypothetical protein
MVEFDGGGVAEGVEDAEHQVGGDESWKVETGKWKLEIGADATPLHYFILVDAVEILSRLFGRTSFYESSQYAKGVIDHSTVLVHRPSQGPSTA